MFNFFTVFIIGLMFSTPFIVDSENKFTFSEIYVIVSDYGIFDRFTQTRARVHR